MSLAILISMLSFSFVMSISPGPVNILIITSGINYGFQKTFAFISGATIGFTLLLAFIGLGFMGVFKAYPSFLLYVEICGALFIMYMGYKIATSSAHLGVAKEKKRLRFYEGFLLQWLNPKAWIACVSGVAMFAEGSYVLEIFIGVYFLICYLCLSFWGVLGGRATHFLNTDKRLKIFNIIMGNILILLALSLVFIPFLRDFLV
jgi:threonine/homoserine/homoserine lactone efflux protein